MIVIALFVDILSAVKIFSHSNLDVTLFAGVIPILGYPLIQSLTNTQKIPICVYGAGQN